MNMPVDTSLLPSLRADLSEKPRQLFIDGKFQSAQSGETFDVVDPSSGETFGGVASGGAADIDLAVKAARRCFDSGAWTNQTPAQRARALTKLADLVEANGSRIALTETLDNGMPLMMAFFGGVAAASE